MKNFRSLLFIFILITWGCSETEDSDILLEKDNNPQNELKIKKMIESYGLKYVPKSQLPKGIKPRQFASFEDFEASVQEFSKHPVLLIEEDYNNARIAQGQYDRKHLNAISLAFGLVNVNLLSTVNYEYCTGNNRFTDVVEISSMRDPGVKAPGVSWQQIGKGSYIIEPSGIQIEYSFKGEVTFLGLFDGSWAGASTTLDIRYITFTNSKIRTAPNGDFQGCPPEEQKRKDNPKPTDGSPGSGSSGGNKSGGFNGGGTPLPTVPRAPSGGPSGISSGGAKPNGSTPRSKPPCIATPRFDACGERD